ncbi:conserved hypothetical protein [Methylocella tundrae]|nr:conserved hypothetical protein [Methylocella tundrae]
MRRSNRVRTRRSAIQAGKYIGDFSVDLTKAGLNFLEAVTRRAHFQRSASFLQFEKADAQISLVSWNLYVRAVRQRS